MKRCWLFSILIFLFFFNTNIGKTQTILSGITFSHYNMPVNGFKFFLSEKQQDYIGVYNFGSNEENRSKLAIELRNGKLIAQLSYSEWNKNDQFVQRKKVLKNFKIIGNILIADGWYGVFTEYNGVVEENESVDEENISLSAFGLIIYQSPWIENEFGVDRNKNIFK